MNKPITYSDAGVSIDAANRAVARIKEMARTTFNARTLSEIGSFGGMFDGAFPKLQAPVLVASADGVGTKLKIAFEANIHDTVGCDLVNHCVNDILVQGARPLFFLDYIATGVLAPETIVSVVAGVARGCRENGCVLLGGETAEMPGFYAAGEYDIAGFIVGVVERAHVIDGSRIMVGDTVLALPSVGLHTNGYSLARKLFFEVAGYKIDKHLDELDMTVSAALLAPHPSYLDVLEGIIDQGVIKGLAHITGGGLLENIPRILPEDVNVEIARGSWPMLPIFSLMQGLGQVSEEEMYRTFNMGIGMIIICASSAASFIKAHIAARGTICYEVGCAVPGTREVKLI